MGPKSDSQASSKNRISELPDAVPCHILSFPSTKHVASTSVLSTRWKNICVSFPNLDFSDRDFSSSADFRSLLIVCSSFVTHQHSKLPSFE